MEMIQWRLQTAREMAKIEKLLSFLTVLDHDVDIVIHQKTSDLASIRVKKIEKQPTHAG